MNIKNLLVKKQEIFKNKENFVLFSFPGFGEQGIHSSNNRYSPARVKNERAQNAGILKPGFFR